MATTELASNLARKQWASRFFQEYVQGNVFSRFFGTNTNSPIQLNESLARGKNRGDTVTFTLANLLNGDGVKGNARLDGAEEKLVQRTFSVTIEQIRNAVELPVPDAENYSAINLFRMAEAELQTWAQENVKQRIIDALHGIDGVKYSDATEAQKDAWLANNADRVLFGASKANNSGNDHSASLANVDATNDKLTSGAISLMKRMALSASPKIRPIRSERNGRRFFLLFVHPLVMRDLKSDTAIQQAQREVNLARENERLFSGGDIMWDGVIVHEVDDLPILSGVGAAGIDVSPVFMVGAQAIAYPIAQRWQPIEEKKDYGNLVGIGVRALDAIEKFRFGTGATDTTSPKDHGVLTGYFSAVADA